MKNVKLSHYSILFPVEERSEFMLYNTRTGGLSILDDKLGSTLQDLKAQGNMPLQDFNGYTKEINNLYDQKFIVDAKIDEKKEFHDNYLAQRERANQYLDKTSINLTIGTTIICNMGCPYCFEFVKPNKTLKDEGNIKGIIRFLEDMIQKAPVGEWTRFNLTWYGGEPLINKKVIETLTPEILDLCSKHNIDYHSNIITNGLLLDLDTWNFLKKHKVNTVQVTVDGTKEIHEKSRPLKGKKGPNYEKILENLSLIPEGMELNLRMNVDRKVAAVFERFFEDLDSYGIWPKLNDRVTISPAWLRTYEEAGETDTMDRYQYDEYFDAIQDLRTIQLKIYNDWALKNNKKNGKLKFIMPSQEKECPTWVSPYGIVIDPEGNIHKCWETIHDDKLSIHHVSEGYDVERFKKYVNYDRFDVHEECYNCPYIPVCDQLSCSVQTENNTKPPCTYWKTRTEKVLKEQYLLLERDPNAIERPVFEVKEMQGHANK
ncbi:radical SAM/SPASM domain-containing protein [Maribacter flavus]|uniref:Radical SAM protein n=1 Tax=Maribacter flavus TaxID=1658664 RepID=A0A5B2TNW5_9FLAO|nr:radical SAM protein [Maribacter flavus]KAA2215793.1 radical SAM protein [Maribacter flavus]